MIKEEILKAYRKMQDKHPDRGEKTIYVTSLLHCTIRPREEIPAVPLIRGTALHNGIQKLLKENGEIEIEFEKEVQKKYGEYVLMGRLDGITKDNVIVEFKTVFKPPKFPYETHIYQVLIYMQMVGSEKGLLVYIGNNEIAEFEISQGQVKNTETGETFPEKYEVNDEWITRQILAYTTKTLVGVYDDCKFCEINKTCNYSKAR